MGLTVISAALLEDEEKLYDFKERKLDYNKLDSLLTRIGEKYSVSLYLVLKAMTLEDPNERLDPFAID